MAAFAPAGTPRGTTDLLLRAILAPPPVARRAWEEFSQSRSFDDVNWHEMRLLAALSERLGELDSQSPYRRRVDGVAKSLWTQMQLLLRQAADALDQLSAAGIPFLIIKGAAQHALGSGSRRIMGDVDILIGRGDAARANDVLIAGGWSGANGESAELLRRTAGIRLGTNYRKGQRGDIDLHIEPYHFSRRNDALTQALWQNAREGSLAARRVLVPDAADSILIALAHAPLSDSGDWALDVAAEMRRGVVDWDRLIDIAAGRGLVPAVSSGLGYLHEALDLALPRDVLARLARVPVPLVDRLKHWANVRERRDRGFVENIVKKSADRFADRLLAPRGYSFGSPERRAVTLARPRLSVRWLLGLSRRLEPLPEGEGQVQAMEVSGVTRSSELVLKLVVRRPAISRRVFFDVSAGDSAFARLRSRTGGFRAGRDHVMLFRCPLPAAVDGRLQLRLQARPIGYPSPDMSADQRARIDPLPFRVAAAWLV